MVDPFNARKVTKIMQYYHLNIWYIVLNLSQSLSFVAHLFLIYTVKWYCSFFSGNDY